MGHANGLSATHTRQQDDPHVPEQLPGHTMHSDSMVVAGAGSLHVFPAPALFGHGLTENIRKELAHLRDVTLRV
ncbi:hypothetical protein [Comamonas aquatica]|nr:hypothetical protein [Comamonas aquatica]